jgi:SAM-dependent methyltransferase
VEVFERREISGWVEVEPGAAAVRVGLYVNGDEVAATWALAKEGRRVAGELRRFRFALYDLWRFTSHTDQVSLRVAGKAIPIVGKGMFYSPRKDGEESLKILKRRLANGYVFGQSGRLQLSKSVDTKWQAAVMGLYGRVNAALDEFFGYQAFLCYGTLLGAVRERGFIGHDLDFDCAYISKHTDGQAILAEVKALAFHLIDQGFDVTAKRTCLAIKDQASGGVKIDLFHLFYTDDGEIRFPFGVAGTSVFHSSQFGQLRTLQLAGAPALVPDSAELLLAHIYGADWRTPNPGFNWQNDRSNSAREGIISLDDVEEVYWANFYSRASYERGSTFCDFVASQAGLPNVVIDIGCGDGRDSYAFAKAGKRVVGVDRSHIGIRHATAKAEKLGYGADIEFHGCDVNNGERLQGIIEHTRLSHPGESLLFYLRFFLHSISAETQDAMMRVLQQCSRPSDFFAAEFRTDKDEAKQKVHGKHFRRYQNGPAFATALAEQYNFAVRIQQEGNGFSPYNGEDPELFRVVAARMD